MSKQTKAKKDGALKTHIKLNSITREFATEAYGRAAAVVAEYEGMTEAQRRDKNNETRNWDNLDAPQYAEAIYQEYHTARAILWAFFASETPDRS